MIKKLAITAMMVATLGNSVLQLENNVQNDSVVKSEKVETIVQNETVENVMNEHDIFEKNDLYDTVVYLPVKAYRMQYQGLEYTLLADGMGEFHITTELLKDGQNYQILYGVESEKIYEIEENPFVFTYENDLNSDENEIRNRGVDIFLSENVVSL